MNESHPPQPRSSRPRTLPAPFRIADAKIENETGRCLVEVGFPRPPSHHPFSASRHRPSLLPRSRTRVLPRLSLGRIPLPSSGMRRLFPFGSSFFFSFFLSFLLTFLFSQQVHGTPLPGKREGGCSPFYTCSRRALLPLTNSRRTPVRFFLFFSFPSLTAPSPIHMPSCSLLHRASPPRHALPSLRRPPSARVALRRVSFAASLCRVTPSPRVALVPRRPRRVALSRRLIHCHASPSSCVALAASLHRHASPSSRVSVASLPAPPSCCLGRAPLKLPSDLQRKWRG